MGFPCVPGFEAAGTVVSNGGGLLGWRLVGKRVAVTTDHKQGLWSQYVVASAMNCIPLPDDISFNHGCSLVNPFTVLMFVDIMKAENHRAAIQTASFSATGKMFLKYCLMEGIEVINIVRKDEHVKQLREIGATYVLNSNSQDFEETLKETAEKIGATVAFEAVGGELTGKVLNNMPDRSVLYLYGLLSSDNVEGINPSGIIFSGKQLKGIWLKTWFPKQGLFKIYRMINRAIQLLPSVFKTEVAKEFGIDQVNEALGFYSNYMSAGKVILKPFLER